MIDTKHQWCIPVDVTNVCNRACSNCTRLVGHAPTFCMSVEQFAEAMEAVKDFPEESPPSKAANIKLIGIIGGEPLLHPRFQDLLHVMAEKIPNRAHRGLWTGLNWQKTKHAEIIRETFVEQYIHNNRHDLQRSRHSPILVASSDAIADPVERAAVIDDCWLQRQWCGTITPKGFFFCEVAGALDWVFGGPGGLPVTPGCWRRPLSDYQKQIDRWCQRCGMALNLKGRYASEERDDVSESNLKLLRDSPRVCAGRYVRYVPAQHTTAAKPWEYRAERIRDG